MAPSAGPSRAAVPAGLALTAAFLWATYYPVVLAVESTTRTGAIVAYPFLAGGAAYLVLAIRRGEAGPFGRGFLNPVYWGRIGLFLGGQVAIVIVTVDAGPIDASLLTLVGDVVVTPILAQAWERRGIGILGEPVFLAGLVLCGAGAGLAILEGGSAEPIRGLAIFAAPLLPIIVAAFYVSAAFANQKAPLAPIAGGAALGAGAVGILVSPLLPGGSGVFQVSPWVLGLLVLIGVLDFCIGPELFFGAIRRVGIFLPAVLMAGIPVFTLGFTAASQHELPPPIGLLGIPIAIIGAYLAVVGTQRRAKRPRGSRRPTIP